ncbi:MAG: hypothetical protein G3M70_14370 [Candidatus Nitronauta litoralis]|uniref:Ankyrin repeat domain-containing protein n=1 Tax=Candidatus Nitronauta litoralis TaxID=2705533 RepID=A0A7T0BXX4_9BACT|nr:MAG: hypothetical protein G3M70_14370 [Candidatus Nitronauta litoralis]
MSNQVTLLKLVVCAGLVVLGPQAVFGSNINKPVKLANFDGNVLMAKNPGSGHSKKDAQPTTGSKAWEKDVAHHLDLFKLQMEDGQDILMDEDPDEIAKWITAVQENLGKYDELLAVMDNPRRVERYQAKLFSHAIFEGHVEIVDLLLARKYPVSARTDAGETPLMLAAAQGNIPIMKKLIDKGASPKEASMTESVLSLAISSGGPKALSILLEAGADPNAGFPHGRTPMFVVVREGNKKAFDILIAVEGIKLDAQSRFGWTPLMEAVAHGQDEMVKSLLENNVDVDQKDVEGNTALMIAARGGRAVSVQHLLEYKADVNARNVRGMTPLMWAVTRPDNGEIISALLGMGADIKDKTAEGQTVASLATANGNEKYAPLLR